MRYKQTKACKILLKLGENMIKAGLEDVVAGSSSICDVDGKEGRLVYQGYDIHDLAKNSNFEEVIYLLWFGKLPNKSEFATFAKALQNNRKLPEAVIKFMQTCPKDANPMDVLRTTVSLLSLYDAETANNDREANINKAIRVTAQIPTIIAYFNSVRNNKPMLSPKEDGSIASNFLYMLNNGETPDELSTKSLDIALILHADHELNASTFAARVAAATLTDLYSSVVAAIGALKGPLHGGANQEVIKTLLDIGETDKVEQYLNDLFADHKKVMGFGHRVYKTEDPRAHHLRQMSKDLGLKLGQSKWYDMSMKIEDRVLKEKGLYPNVDFYSASVYYMLGIPVDLYTPIFAMSRISGWSAHILEQYSNNRLIRPRAEYIGPKNLSYAYIDKR